MKNEQLGEKGKKFATGLNHDVILSCLCQKMSRLLESKRIQNQSVCFVKPLLIISIQMEINTLGRRSHLGFSTKLFSYETLSTVFHAKILWCNLIAS